MSSRTKASADTPLYEVCRRSPLTVFENHYEEREREPDRNEWGPWKRAANNTLRTCAGGYVVFEEPGKESTRGHEVDLDRCATNDEAWGWIRHLAQKTWVSTDLLMSLEETLFDLGYITCFPSWTRWYDPGPQAHPERRGRGGDEAVH